MKHSDKYNRLLCLCIFFLLLLGSFGFAFPVRGKERPVIWIGDSRCVGISKLCEIAPDDIFIAEGEKSLYWFNKVAIPQLERILDADPNYAVVIMLGVNDCYNQAFGALESYSSYVPVINHLMRHYPDTVFCFCSVNPVDDKFRVSSTINNMHYRHDMDSFNPIIETFNAYLEKHCGAYYFNSYDYLFENGFETTDGIHYTKETYQKIYDFCRGKLESPLISHALRSAVRPRNGLCRFPRFPFTSAQGAR